MNDSGAASRALRLVTPAGLFALALAVRALPWPRVLTDSRVYPFGNDAYYHLRRIGHSVANFPSVLEFDPYVQFPAGAKPIWTPFFDLFVAALARPWIRDLSSGGVGDLARFAVWVPPVLGAACVVAVYALVRKHFGFAPAVLAGLVLSLLSGHSWYSQIGFIDHHAAVALVTTLMLGASMTLLRAEARGQPGVAWRQTLWTGVLCGAALLLWPGSLLHLGLLECGFYLFLLTRVVRADAIAFADRLTVLHGAAFLLVAPFALGNEWPQWSAFSPVVLTNFQPWILALIGAATLIARALWGVDAWGATRGRRLASFLAVVIAAITASAVLLPDLLLGAEDAWRWLAKQDLFQLYVAESRPLLFTEGRFELSTAMRRLSYFALLFPFATAALAYAVRGERDRASVWLLLGWGAGLFAITLLQRRFFNSFSVALAAVFAISVYWTFRALAARTRTGSRRALAIAGCGAALVLLMQPSLRTYVSDLRNLRVAARGEKMQVASNILLAHAAVQTSVWLRRHSPRTSGWLDPSRLPEYGVLTPWYLGHLVKYVARRPTLVDNFGDDVGEEGFAWAHGYYARSEAEVEPELDARSVRYVVVHRAQDTRWEEYAPDSLYYALYTHDGSRLAPESGDQPVVPALTRHRLVYESRAIPTGGADGPAIFKLYEVVPGARVVGTGRPGAEIEIALTLRSNRDREIAYEARARVDAAGRYEVRLPYATLDGAPATKTDPAYRFTCDGHTQPLALKEEQVQQGRVVIGPALCH
jgi:dolichyl-diphosphooligosaccharide--protein glycosyltransferase